MRYVAARCKQYSRDESYRIYVTEGLKSICGFKVRWYDIVEQKPVEDVNPEEIKARIFRKLEGMKHEPV